MHNLEYKCTFGLEHPVELLDVVGDELLVRDVGGGGDLQGSWAGGQDSEMKAFRISRIQDSGFRGRDSRMFGGGVVLGVLWALCVVQRKGVLEGALRTCQA